MFTFSLPQLPSSLQSFVVNLSLRPRINPNSVDAAGIDAVIAHNRAPSGENCDSCTDCSLALRFLSAAYASQNVQQHVRPLLEVVEQIIKEVAAVVRRAGLRFISSLSLSST